MDEPHIHAFAPHVLRGEADQHNAQPVQFLPGSVGSPLPTLARPSYACHRAPRSRLGVWWVVREARLFLRRLGGLLTADARAAAWVVSPAPAPTSRPAAPRLEVGSADGRDEVCRPAAPGSPRSRYPYPLVGRAGVA